MGGGLIAFAPRQIEEHFQSKVEASPIGRPADLFSCLCIGGEDGLGTPWNGKKVSQSSELSGLSGFAINPQASQPVLRSRGERIWALGLPAGKLSKAALRDRSSEDTSRFPSWPKLKGSETLRQEES